MAEKGLAETSVETIPAPMYVEMEQDEDVARGCVKVTELIMYDVTKEKRRYTPEKPGIKGEIMKDKEGNVLYVEIGHKPYFCQTKEQEITFAANNPDARIETHTLQVLKQTAIGFLNSERNMEQFKEKDNA